MQSGRHDQFQGDDGELYELSVNNEIMSRHMGPRLENDNKSKEKKPWWKWYNTLPKKKKALPWKRNGL